MTELMPASEDLYKDSVFVHTQNGEFQLDDPKFNINDIAHSLSLNCRFNGHVNYFYSVAQHSIMVAKLMDFLDLGDPFEGLMHDATEAYMSDVPAPFKSRLPDWKAIDAKLEYALRQCYGLPLTKTEGCKKADWLALFIEAACLLPSGGHGFHDPLGLRSEAIQLLGNYPQLWYPHPELPNVVRSTFLNFYDELRGV